jgi:hypothetical protein
LNAVLTTLISPLRVDDDKVEYLYATVTFKILRYNTTYTKKIKVGEVSHE